MRFRFFILMVLSAFLFSFSTDARAAFSIKMKRYALIVGNSKYKDGAGLKNPLNDASDMSNLLKQLGFSVTKKENITQRQFETSVKKLGRNLKKAGQGAVGLFYFAGHGVQVDNRNYLIPVDTYIENELDIKYKGINTNWILETMSKDTESLNILILDACRSAYPLTRKFRSSLRGLAEMRGAGYADGGALIAFSTAPGAVASDGDGRNGIFTKHLLKYMGKKELEIEDVFKLVRMDVARETQNKQIPWSHSSTLREFYFVPRIDSPRVVRKDGIFIAYDNGTVKDEKTGLMWALKDNGQNIDWKGAKKYCEKLETGGFGDWRMPTIQELKTLYVKDRRSSPKCSRTRAIHITNLIEITCCCLWASDIRANAGAFLNYSTGNQLWYYQNSTDMASVLPVRSYLSAARTSRK